MGKIEYAFLSTLIPKELEDDVRSKSIANMPDAAIALQNHLYSGLYRNITQPICIFNILPIGSFPQNYKSAFISEDLFSTPEQSKLYNLGFCNIKLIRRYDQPRRIYKAISKWCARNTSSKVLFVYTLSSSFMIAVHRLKREFPQLKVCAIVADLPNMGCLASNQSGLKKRFIDKFANESYSRLDAVDYFVLLTQQMADYMHITQPYCVVEGIATQPKEMVQEGGAESGFKTIMYTGTLHKKFGILNLLKAFEQIEGSEYRLIICGIGDSEEEIRRAAEADHRIDFRGQLTREEVLKLQRSASVLVNPRQNTEEFTKYSFPSKNLEYLSSGIPLVAYKLDGIPDEYDEHIYYVQDNSVVALKNRLVEVCEMDARLRRKKATAAQKYVLAEKNEVKQTEKILKLIQTEI